MKFIHTADIHLDSPTKLAEDEEPMVRYAVAKNPNCPAEVIVKLAGDKYHLIRCAVAENTSCPVELLAKLAKSRIVSIRVTFHYT